MCCVALNRLWLQPGVAATAATKHVRSNCQLFQTRVCGVHHLALYSLLYQAVLYYVFPGMAETQLGMLCLC
jgi:hypothetical protein